MNRASAANDEPRLIRSQFDLACNNPRLSRPAWARGLSRLFWELIMVGGIPLTIIRIRKSGKTYSPFIRVYQVALARAGAWIKTLGTE